MPRYRILTRIIDEFEDTYTAANEQAARDSAYAEAEPDIPDGGYVEHIVVQLPE